MANPLLNNTKFSRGLHDPSLNEPIKESKNLSNPNPYEEGTLQHQEFKAFKSDWDKNRGLILGTTQSGLNNDAVRWDKTDDDYTKKQPLKDYDKKDRNNIVGDRKKYLKYAVENNLMTEEDWDKHEIKDKTIQWLHNESEDIKGVRDNIFGYLKTMKEYGLSDEELFAVKQNKKTQANSNIGSTNPTIKDGTKLVAPLAQKPLSLLPEPDPVEMYATKKKAERIGVPAPPHIAQTLEETPLAKRVPDTFKAFANDVFDETFNSLFTSEQDSKAKLDPIDYTKPLSRTLKDNLYSDSPLQLNAKESALKDELANTERIPTAKEFKRADRRAKNTHPIDSLLYANIDVVFDKKTNEFTYNVKDKNKSIDDVINELTDFSTKLIDNSAKEYAKKHNSGIVGQNFVGNLAKEKAGLEQNELDYKKLGVMPNPAELMLIDLPEQMRDIALSVNDRLNQLRILKAKKAFGHKTSLKVPEGIDKDELELSVARGLSPSIINKPISDALGIDFDITSLVKTAINSVDLPVKQVLNLVTDGDYNPDIISLISDPRKILSKQYTDSEAMQALIGIYQNKFDFSPSEAKYEIQQGFKDINKAQDQWGHATRNIVNSLGELSGELLGPFKLGAKGFDKIAEKGQWIGKYIEKIGIDKIKNFPQFQGRMRNLQRALEGKSNIGGGVLPYYDELYGMATTNVARVTAASFGSQLFWHGADVDEAVASAENMGVLEALNQSFGFAGIRGVKYFNSIAKGLKGAKGIQYADDLALKYKQYANTVYALSSFPAQGLSTLIMNPNATNKEFASELIMNLFMSGNNFMAHREMAKELQSYKQRREDIDKLNLNWSNQSINRRVETMSVDDLINNQAEYKKNSEVNNETMEYGNVESTINNDGILEETTQVRIEKVEGLGDFTRRTVGKTDKRKRLNVEDLKDVVRESVPEELRASSDKLFDIIGKTKIEIINDPKDNSPAHYDRVNNRIVINNAVEGYSTNETLARVVMHEGVHVLTVDAYANDKSFKDDIDNIAKELLDSQDFDKLRKELKLSTNEVDIKASYDIEYAMQSPLELIALMYDPGMSEGRNAINKITSQKEGEEKAKNFKDRLWDSISKWFGKTHTPEETNDYITRFRGIVEGHTFNANESSIKQEKPSEEAITGLEQQPMEESFTSKIDVPVFWMPELINPDAFREYNEKRKEYKYPEINKEQLEADYKSEYNRNPNPMGMDMYLKRKLASLKPNADNFDNAINEIAKSEDFSNDGYIDKAELRIAKEVFNVPNMDSVYEKSQDKTTAEVRDLIREQVKLKHNDATNEAVEKIAVIEANRIKQVRTVVLDEIIVNKDGSVDIAPIYGQFYEGTKPLDRTMGQQHYFNNFTTNFTKSLYNTNGKIKPYVTERIPKFISLITENNLRKIGGFNIDGKKSNETTTDKLTGNTPIQLIKKGFYVLPTGARAESLIRIPGLENIANNKVSALGFAKDVQQFNFFKWLDSDSQWIGSKEGIYTGRRLAELGGTFDFDKLYNKYVDKQPLTYNELLKDAITGEIDTKDIDLIGSKLLQYYSDATGQTFKPEYLELQNKSEINRTDIAKILNESITELLTWRLDAGGGDRTITLKNNELGNKKSSNKYASIASTSHALFKDVEDFKIFVPQALKEDGSFDKPLLKELGFHVLPDGNIAKPAVFPNEMMFSKSPFLLSHFNKSASDGSTLELNKASYDIMTDAMLKGNEDPALQKPKGQMYDADGNTFIYKTAIFDTAGDKFSDTYHPELRQFFDTVKDAVTLFSASTSSKGTNTFRTKEHPLAHSDNTNAKAIFDNTGNIVDVIVKNESGYKSDQDLLEKEIEYMADNWAKGIVDPRSIIMLPITGTNAITYLETSHPATNKGGAIGFTQNLTFHKDFELFNNDSGVRVMQSINNWEDNIVGLAKHSINSAYNLRGMLEGVSNMLSISGKTAPEATNAKEANIREFGFDNKEKLKGAGDVVLDLIDEVKRKAEKSETDDFMLPGMNHNEAIKLLEETVNQEGEIIPQKLFNLYLAGNMFVSGMKMGAPGERTMLQYMIRDKFKDATLTRSYGANLSLVPDFDSRASMARLYEPMIEQLRLDNETEKANQLQREYGDAVRDNIDEFGKLLPFSQGVIVGKDVMKKFNLRPGQKVLMKLTPADDLHTITPMIIAGVSNKEGTLTGNAEYLTQVNGRDFDKDNMQLLFQNDKYISETDFMNVWNHWNDSDMVQGRYKKNANEYRENEVKLVNGAYKPLGNKFEYQNPTMTPQFPNGYDRIQTMHRDISHSVSTRNLITNGNRNMNWNSTEKGMTTKVNIKIIDEKGEPLEKNIQLYLANKGDGKNNRAAETSSAINNKMVDMYDLMPFDPNKAVWDQMIYRVDGIDYAKLNSKEKAEIRRGLANVYQGISGDGIKKVLESKDYNEIAQAIKKANLTGESPTSKSGRMLTEVQTRITNKPEINKYKFNNTIGQKLQQETIRMEKEYAKKLPPELHSHLFNSYRGSKLNVAQHLQEMFNKYTNVFISPNSSDAMRATAYEKDIYPHISTDDFGAFREKTSWKNIAAGTALNDYFSNNGHKPDTMVDNKVFKGGYEYQYDGYNGWIVNGENRVRLDNIFAENGDLRVDWLTGDVLSSSWLRGLAQRKSIASDNYKALLIGKTLANVSKFLESKIPEVDAREMFTMLAYNSTGNVNVIERSESTKKGYANALHNWFHGNRKASVNSLKAVNNEIDKEMRYDPLTLLQGAKQIGLNPMAGGKDILEHMKDIAYDRGKKAFGSEESINVADRYNMPSLSYRTSDRRTELNTKTPKKFFKSMENLLGKSGLENIKNSADLNENNYGEVFDKVLAPAIKDYIKERGKKYEWSEDKLNTMISQYIRHFGPDGMEITLAHIEANNSNTTDKAVKGIGAKDFQEDNAYRNQLAFLSRSLEKQFKHKKDSRLTHLVPFQDRSPIPVLINYTSPSSKRNYSRNDVIADLVHSKNGELQITKDQETGFDITTTTPFKVGDIVDEALNVSVNNATLPVAYVDFIAKRKALEEIAQMSEVSIEDFLNKSTVGKDVKIESNPAVTEVLRVMNEDNGLADLINTTEVQTEFNGVYQPAKTRLSYEGNVRTVEESFDSIVESITNNWVDREIEFHREASKNDEVPTIINRKELHELAKKSSADIENALRIKGLTMGIADVMVSLAHTTDHMIDSMGDRLPGILQDEVFVQTKRVKEFAQKLINPDFKNVMKQLRAIDFANAKNIETIEKVIHEASVETLKEYGNFYDERATKYAEKDEEGTNKNILTKGMFPEIFAKLPGGDNIPLFPYFAQKILKDTTINNIETGEYNPQVMTDYRKEITRVIGKLQPELSKEELMSKSNELWKDLVEVNSKRYNINANLYGYGHKMGLEGFEIPLNEATPEEVFKKGYTLRKEIMRQFDNKVKQIADRYEITMVEHDKDDISFEVNGLQIDLADFIIAVKPELAYDETFFTNSVSNLKETAKNLQNALIGSVENAFKTTYIKENKDDSPFIQDIVLGQLGHVSGNKAMYNKSYNSEQIRQANFEPGTDSFVRYLDKKGEPHTIYGRILGTRDIDFQMVNDLDGGKRIDTRKFLFVISDKNQNKKLHAINIDVINDAITGQAYGGFYSQPVMYNKKIKQIYSKNNEALLDDLASSLSKKSMYIAENRKESDAFIKNVDQRMRFTDKTGAIKSFENVIELSHDKMDKSLASKLKTAQDFTTQMIVADTYMGGRYIAEAFVGTGLAVGGFLSFNPAMGSLGLMMAMRGVGKYSERLLRLKLSNSLGTMGWVARNPVNQAFIVGNLLEVFKAASTSLGMADGSKVNKDTMRDALGESMSMQLRKGTDNRAKEMLEESVYEGTNLRNKVFKDLRNDMVVSKQYQKEFKKLNEVVDQWKDQSSHLDDILNPFFEGIVNEYANKQNKRTKKPIELKVVKGIPFLDNKPLDYYKQQELSLMTLANFYLTWKGKFVEYEVKSQANTAKVTADNIRRYHEVAEQNLKALSGADNSRFQENLTRLLVKKSTGAYEKTPHQQRFTINTAEKYSRFGLLQKVDQLKYQKERYDMHSAIYAELKKDKEYMNYKSLLKRTGGIPIEGYKINSPGKELAFGAAAGIVSGLASFFGYNELEEKLGESEQWFGISLLQHNIMKVGVSLAAILVQEEGKSPNSNLNKLFWNTGSAMGGFVGYGVSVPMQESLIQMELLLYDNYYQNMSSKDRKKVQRHFEPYKEQSLYKGASNLLPIPGLNTVLRNKDKIEKAIEEDSE